MNIVEIPIPPSTNNLWRAARSGGGKKTKVYLSAKYAAWLPEAILRIRMGMSKVKTFPAEIRLTIRGGKGWKADRDLSNAFKAVEDAVVKAGVLPNDSTGYVTRCVLQYLPAAWDGAPATCHVEVVPIAA